MSCGVGRRLQLIQPLAWAPPYTAGAAIKRQTEKDGRKEERNVVAMADVTKGGGCWGLGIRLGEEVWTRDKKQLSQRCTAISGQHSQAWSSDYSLCFFSAPAWSSAQRPWTTAVDFTITRSVYSRDRTSVCLQGAFLSLETAVPIFLSPASPLGKPPGLDLPQIEKTHGENGQSI